MLKNITNVLKRLIFFVETRVSFTRSLLHWTEITKWVINTM